MVTNLYVGGFLNTNFKINQCQGESSCLRTLLLNVLESYTLNRTFHDAGRPQLGAKADGAADWEVCVDPSPGAANGADPFDMYTGYAPTPAFDVESVTTPGRFRQLVVPAD